MLDIDKCIYSLYLKIVLYVKKVSQTSSCETRDASYMGDVYPYRDVYDFFVNEI